MSENPTVRTRDHERPLSPHLGIYKPQITSILSITHRATGVVLAAGLVLFVAWLWIAAYCEESYVPFTEYASTIWGKLFLAGWSWAFFYHMLNGIRHLFWDMGQGLEMDVATRSGWIVVIGSLFITGYLWFSQFGSPF